MRQENGFSRTTCSCNLCRRYCKFMPGYLIPSDLTRIAHENKDNIFKWAEENLLASPGAIVSKDGNVFRIPTLVPKTKPNSTVCKWFDAKTEQCAVHENAPYGCAFFSCEDHELNPTSQARSRYGLEKICEDINANGLYSEIWNHLVSKNMIAESVEIKRARLCQVS